MGTPEMGSQRIATGSDPREVASRIRALAPALGDLPEEVAGTIEAVRGGGDAALLDLVERFDGARMDDLRVSASALDAARESLDPALVEALEVAAQNIRAVAKAQLQSEPVAVALPQGQEVRVRSVAVGAAGVYVPGGGASYPSSVLMGCIPARVAGTSRVVVATPPGPDARVDPAVLAACGLVGADEVYAVGGAHAIAMLAYGTETIDPVDVIAGPGSARVQEAKVQVSRDVGIDSYAGPSELMVAFDDAQAVEWLTLDLLAQGEHGGAGLLVAAAPDGALLDALDAEFAARAVELDVELPPLALIETTDNEASVEIANALAPEHLQIVADDARELADLVRTAGCVLVGTAAGTAFGDYVAGSNHILPTGGAGRFAGPVGPGTFRRPISIVDIPAEAAMELAPLVRELAEREGFPAHARSAAARAGAERATDVAAKMEGS